MLRQESIQGAAKPVTETKHHSPVPWLVAAVIILAVVALALGAMLAAPMVTTTPNEALVDRMAAAWTKFDEATLRDVYTEDAFIWTSDTTTPTKGVDDIVGVARWSGTTVERIGPTTERGNLVSYPVHVSSTFDVSGSDAVAVLYMRDGKIAQHWVIWDEL